MRCVDTGADAAALVVFLYRCACRQASTLGKEKTTSCGRMRSSTADFCLRLIEQLLAFRAAALPSPGCRRRPCTHAAHTRLAERSTRVSHCRGQRCPVFARADNWVHRMPLWASTRRVVPCSVRWMLSTVCQPLRNRCPSPRSCASDTHVQHTHLTSTHMTTARRLASRGGATPPRAWLLLILAAVLCTAQPASAAESAHTRGSPARSGSLPVGVRVKPAPAACAAQPPAPPAWPTAALLWQQLVQQPGPPPGRPPLAAQVPSAEHSCAAPHRRRCPMRPGAHTGRTCRVSGAALARGSGGC